MSLSSPGVGSGLDVKAIVDAYVKAEVTPLQSRHDKKLTSVTTELSAIGQLKSTLGSLQTSLTTLSDIGKFYGMKYTLSDPDHLSASITADAIKGSYQIEVQKLAQQQNLASDYIADPSNVGSGALTITFGTYNVAKTTFTNNAAATPITVNIAPGNGSLIAIRDAINDSSSEVSAAIVDDNLGSRLTITSTQTGESYAMKISGGISALNYDPTTGVNALTETIAAQNSVVKINGLTVTQESNSLTTAITGTTLTLKKEDVGVTTTLTVDDNKAQVSSLLNDFIKKYNDSMTFLTNLTGYNSATKQSGMFQGDPQFRNLKLNLNKWATSPLPTTSTSPIKTIADLGITTDKTGLLVIDTDIFNNALTNNYKDIGALFAKTGSATDSSIRVDSVASTVKAGSYDVALSAYTPGVTLTGTIGDLAASSNDGTILKGSLALQGLNLKVLSGSTGARGTVTVTDGLAVRMNSFLDTYMGTTGDLNLRADQLNTQVKQLARSQTSIDTRSASIEARYLKQFTALDVLLTQLTNTSSSLTQQLASLPSLKLK